MAAEDDPTNQNRKIIIWSLLIKWILTEICFFYTFSFYVYNEFYSQNFQRKYFCQWRFHRKKAIAEGEKKAEIQVV